jgi:tRNA A-37 threonylcarbamoyl transferase component Bud32
MVKAALETIVSPLRAASTVMAKRIVAPASEWSKCDDVSELLIEPWRLIEAPEGVVAVGCPGLREAAEKILGESVKCRAPRIYSSSLVCESGSSRVVVKEYVRMIVKWIASLPLSYTRYKYRLTPKARMASEYKYFKELRRVIETPYVLLLCGDYHKSLMVRSYIDGTPVVDSDSKGLWEEAGLALAKIHKSGFTLGDPNPGNILVLPSGGQAVIDAEQARRYTITGGAWDLAVFSIYSFFIGKREELVEAAITMYKEEAKDLWVKERDLLRKSYFWAPLTILPHLVFKAKKLLTRL